MNRRTAMLAAALLPLVALTACNDSTAKTSDTTPTLNLGFFANLTHATPQVGLDKGFFADKLGPNVTVKTQVFNAGPAAVEALIAKTLDATYIGPNPAINAFTKTKGAIRIVAGATSGGAALVVKDGITDVAGLKGKTIATPSLGNTQDVALRAWLKGQGLQTTLTGRGDYLKIAPTENSTTLDLFQGGQIEGAWVPEPWATRLVQAGGHVLVDEKTLWPAGQFVTTHLIVRTAYLEEHPDVVKRLLEGHVAANEWINANSDEAKAVVNASIEKLTGKPLKTEVIDAAWPKLTVTNDPIAGSLKASADHALALELLKTSELKGIYDLTLLNGVLVAAGKPVVADGGLGV